MHVKIQNVYIGVLTLFSIFMLFSYLDTSKEIVILIGLLIGIIVLWLYKSGRSISKNMFLIMTMYVTSVVVTVSSYPGLGCGVLLLCILFAMCTFDKIYLREKEFLFLHILLGISIILFLLMFDFTYINSGSVYNSRYSLNSNSVGLLSFAAYAHFMCAIAFFRRKNIKIFFTIVLTVWLGYWVFISDSRTALFVMAVFIATKLLKLDGFIQNHYKKIIIILLISSLVFPLIYVKLSTLFGDAMLMNKYLFSGRQYLWADAFKQIAENPFFGSGTLHSYDVGDGTITSSAHNMLLGVLRMFGIIPTVTIIFRLGGSLNNSIESERTKAFVFNTTAMNAFVCSLIFAFSESFLTDSHFCLLFLTFMIFRIEPEVD